MKRNILLIIIMLALIPTIYAQDKGLRLGVLAGVNFQNFNGKDNVGDKLENKMITGFHAGINSLIPIAPDIFFQPGLVFSIKGAQQKDASPNAKFMLNYIDLPLNIVYRPQLGENFFLLGFGPYLGYALGGKIIDDNGDKTDIEFMKTIESGDPLSSAMKRFDAGAGIFAGYELSNGIFLQLDTQLGLIKINADNKNIPDDKLSIKNTGFGLSVGFRF
jgi:hypothetical protein